jgi:flagellar basal-body rod modification protein FlgD
MTDTANGIVSAAAGSLVDSRYAKPADETPAPSNELGKDAFLKLLVAQLRYQDPLEPSTSEEFIATTAQFTVVEKLDELTKQGENTALVNSLMTASSLVGREVTALKDGVEVTAVVDRSRLQAGEVVLDTSEGEMRMNEIVSVGAPQGESNESDEGSDSQSSETV